MRNVEFYLLSYLINSLWQVPLLFAAGWFAARLLRSAGASVEHRVWVITLLLQSAVPACSLFPGEWLGRLIFWAGNLSRPTDAHVSVIMAGGTSAGTLEWPIAWVTTITIVYATTCSWFAARFLWRTTRLRAMREEAVDLELTGEAAHSWDRCCRRFGVENAALVVSPYIAGPVTMGLRRKLVLLPETMAAIVQTEDLHTVMAHECAHMRRNDFAKNLVYELLSLPVAYHPLLWLTRERIMETREMVCDQLAALMTERNEYARSLLRLASLVKGIPARTPHTIGIFDANAFERRLMNLSGKQKHIGIARRVATLAACAAVAFGTCGVAVALGMHVDQAPNSGTGQTSKRPKSLHVSADKMSGNLLNKTVPQYPPAAKKAKIEGTVVLSAVISKDGSVEQLKVVSGPKELQQSSLDAVRQWTYKPYLLNGDPIEVQTTVNIIYSLAG